MRHNKEDIAEQFLNEAMIECKIEADKFRFNNSVLLGELIAENRFLDLTNIFFKQGFLIGMKHQKSMREKLLREL